MSNATLSSYNPATGEFVGDVPVTPVSEIPAVVAHARTACSKWGALSHAQRKELLLPFGERLRDQQEELAALLTAEMGKPLSDALGEVKRASKPFAEYLDEIEAALATEMIEDKYVRSEVSCEPYGVCVAISPWNFPLYMPHWMVIPALMAGNAVILKPSEETPLIAQAYVDILQDLLPDGVVTIVHGDEEQGKALVSSHVDLISFTGSREAGKHIMAAAAKGLKRVILELGGKDPLVVLEDADLEKAAEYATFNGFRNAGQVCVSTERVYVDSALYEDFLVQLQKNVEKLVVGNGADEGVTIGPLIHEKQREHVVAQINNAVEQGATVVGDLHAYSERFLAPLVVTGVSHDMDIMRQETFGPVLCVMPFDSVDQAIELANDTPFGLGAAVYGRDVQRATEVAKQIDAGMVGVNQGVYGAKGCPWVGAKESGIGFHSGPRGHRQFAQVKVISLPK